MGTLRFYLAVCVFIWHCWAVDERHFLHSFAAVYCFFIMSGFYISMTLARAYPATADGTLRFYANRALRLFPTYLAVLFATAAAYAVGLFPYGMTGLNDFNPIALVNQMTVLPETLWRNLTLNTAPATNSLTIGWYYTVGLEMIFYALGPFFVRWRLPNLILLFVAAGIVHFVPNMLGLDVWQWQYNFFPSTAVFFVAGVLSYRLYLAIKDDANKYVGWLAVLGVMAYGFFFDSVIYTNAFQPFAIYVGLALMLPFIFIASQQRYIRAVDKFLADISYPFYVVHGLAAALVGGGVGLPTNIFAGLAAAVGLSIVLHLGVEVPVEKMRSAIKSHGTLPAWARRPLERQQA